MKKNRKNMDNPIMQNKKIKSLNKNVNNSNDDEHIIRNFIILIVVIAAIIIAIYFISNALNDNKNNYERKVTEGSINYSVLTIGTLLNRPYDDYYVLIYNSEDENASDYAKTISTYIANNSEKKNYRKIYFCDLDNKLNQDYYNVGNDNKSNPKAKDIASLDLGDLTLLRINKGKIVEYIEDYKTIQEKLK